MLLDTTTNIMWHYKKATNNAWLRLNLLPSDTASMLTNYYRSGRTGIIKASDVPTLNQSTTGSAATLTTSRTFQTNLASTSTASFNGSANVTPGVTGTLPVANGGTNASTFTAGSVVFAGNGGTYTQDNSNLFWNDTDNRLGIGTSSPTERLTINAAAASTSTNYQFKNISVTSGFTSGYTNNTIVSLLAGYDGPSIYGTDIGYGYDGTGYTLFFSTNDNTGGNAIERMRITSNGNVGIGTSNIVQWNGAAGVVVNQYSASGNSIYSLQTNSTSLDQGSIFEAYSNAVTTGSKALGSIAFLRENTSTTALSSYTGFYTNNGGNVAERMRITSGGNVGIGTTPSVQFHTTGGVRFANFGAGTATFDASGNISSSDSRLKKQDFAYKVEGLKEIMQLKPIAFKLLTDIKERGNISETQIGFFADDVAQIIPSASFLGNDGYYNYLDRGILAALVKAVQEQQEIIEGLKTRILTLENK
ncbi:MAG: hypothetical protein EBR82_69910 [Caulobacteraceae bacterium]|nr:hypothetical protein [Caulobacteraceae bacterium]